LLTASLILAGALLTAGGSGCEGWAAWTGCEVSNSGTQVDIGASLDIPAERPRNPARPPAEAGRAEPAVERTECDTPLCREGYAVGTLPDVTLADLASFVPAKPSLTGEPAGFGVEGLPANIVAAASEQRMPGTVLGWDVVVRFVPSAYVFEYGDGATRRSATGGAAWEHLGLAQFSPTATSHVYRERGTYPVAVSVEYAASVDFGTGWWRPVPGVVTARTSGYEIEVLRASTALVDRTCTEDPHGPGC
jgi:hypothetical protein